jgi:hypothetical protein
LLASKTARQEQWAAGHPTLPDLAERYQQLVEEIERLRRRAPPTRHRPARQASLI